MNDLDLLRKFEPVVRFTQGELFFPCAVDGYVQRSSLWLLDDRGKNQQLVPEGELTSEKLAEFKEVPPGHTLYLRFVEKPLDPLEYQQWLRRPNRPAFLAPGRLSRVGLFSRILDSLFNLSLVLRGKVPGGTTAANEIKYRHLCAGDPRYVYYGRVIREAGYIVLHYLFFYTMNNWRSSFYGANDHEADWEQIFIYLTEEAEAEPRPRWLAYASHDFSGDDLRRRWDDPELTKVGQNHPVVFAGAGSHASYFQPGEYLMGVQPKFLQPLKKGLVALRKIWVETLGQGRAEKVEEQVSAQLSIPFIDYGRGDGLSIGPEQPHSWQPIILTPATGWAEQYRGLWGLDTQDPFGGERAPAGPKYNRDGSVRVAWYDPLGWAGLDKVTPPGLAPAKMAEHIANLNRQRETLQQQIEQRRAGVRQLDLEVRALHESDYLSHLYKTQQDKLSSAQNELQGLYAAYTKLTETSIASQAYLEKIKQGDWGDPQAHIHHKHPPEPPLGQQARLVELWAAVSSGLLLFVLITLFAFIPSLWLTWVVLVAAIFIIIEATLRGRLPNLLLNVTIVLAIITGLVLVKDFWWLILFVLAFALVVTMIKENLQELWSK